jgi:hypothetical protein
MNDTLDILRAMKEMGVELPKSQHEKSVDRYEQGRLKWIKKNKKMLRKKKKLRKEKRKMRKINCKK